MTRTRVTILLLLAGVALAAGDPRGWSEGQPAARAARVLQPINEEPVAAKLPEALAKRIKKPTLLLYFSPTCPHCKRVAPELQALHERLGKRGQVLGIASTSSTKEALDAFKTEFGVKFPIVHDADGEIGTAMSIRSTPSAMLVAPEKKDLFYVDLWYPYTPGTDVLVEMRVADNPWSVFKPHEYKGNTACGACHQQEMESWLLTHHSIAWRTLAEHESTEDDACTSCHVTGAGQATGWAGEAGSRLVDVGCEACHGPGGPHDGHVTAPETTCEGCHDAKHSIGFRYDKGLPLLDHFRSASMPDAKWVEARRALLDGEVEQSLLSFDEGTYVGAEACAACHPSETAHWEGSPHAHAMATLEAGGSASDPSCVSCHATQREPGLKSASLEGYRTDESVGCEACHGPGGAHVEAGGGSDNIVGLGESCPVCVIEAVCTSCHNQTWDANWDLEARLANARHSTSPPVTKPAEGAPVTDE
jgi:thiol-disulfide isomerase/thioredoxin